MNEIEILTDYLSINYREQFDTSFTSKNFQRCKTKDGILILESSGVIQEANETACSLMGFEKEELLGVSIEYFFIEASFFIKSDWDKSKTNSILFEKILFNLERRIVYAEINVYAPSNNKIFVIIKDNSAKKISDEQNQKICEELKSNRGILHEQSAELIKLRKQLRESEERQKELIIDNDSFFSNLTHDIKSPFNGLLGLSSILCEEFDSMEKEKMKEYLILMDSLIKNQYRQIENLLDWSCLQSGRMRYDPIKISILNSLTAIIELLSLNAKSKSISLINNVKQNIFIKADARMLNSVLENILMNAIKFTQTGGKISVESFVEENFLGLIVKDSGIGMESSLLKNIFRIGATHSVTETKKEKGTGLGLIICKEMIEKQEGSMLINSKPGEGTEVIVKLPIWKSEEDETFQVRKTTTVK